CTKYGCTGITSRPSRSSAVRGSTGTVGRPGTIRGTAARWSWTSRVEPGACTGTQGIHCSGTERLTSSRPSATRRPTRPPPGPGRHGRLEAPHHVGHLVAHERDLLERGPLLDLRGDGQHEQRRVRLARSDQGAREHRPPLPRVVVPRARGGDPVPLSEHGGHG